MARFPNIRTCPCVIKSGGRVFPVPRPEPLRDYRFTRALVLEVGDVLADHGFPEINDDSPDMYALMWCLARFCYGIRGCDDDTQGNGS